MAKKKKAAAQIEDTATEAQLVEQAEALAMQAEEEMAIAPIEAVQEAAPVEAEGSDLITDKEQILQAMEALIFASPKVLTLQRLKNILTAFRYDISNLGEMIATLEEKYARAGFQLQRVGKGLQFRSAPEHSELMQKLLEDRPQRLSQSALEVLAIIAYKQPITRAEIDAVRGVDSGHLLKGLLEKDMVRIEGQAETPGRPMLYATTPYFLEIFSLNDLAALPALDDMQRELKPSGENGEGAEDQDPTVLAAEPDFEGGLGLLGRESPLAANPDRGDFDAPTTEDVEAADFGLAERAKEEVDAQA